MKSSANMVGGPAPTTPKILMAIVSAFLLGGMFAAPAFAARDQGRDRADQHGARNQPDQRAYRRGNERRSHYRRAYNYGQPVYVPPPVYYEPPQSPGINLFFPLDFRQRR